MSARNWLMGAVAALAIAATPAAAPRAAEAEVHIPDAHFSFAGPFGTFDRAALQRGAQIYTAVCANCHALHQLSYRNLRDIGLSEAQVAAIAASVQVNDAPNDEGIVNQRPGRPSDRFRSPFANENAARAANGGAYPPDLSVMVKARHDGANYIHALLTGYEEPPAGVTVPNGMYYNKYFPGHLIGMAPPLSDGSQTFADGTNATTDQMARDVATFLAWAAEPELEQRRAMGVRMVIFLTILGGLVYAVKRKIWADVH
ncbi:cytochrome c1 [Roseomonas sp. OT10]|uniref:cytochrome c1 n=1 Tax=Roseomonas cutis TaxID=2897332 RepID=UPI001E514D61|nr:cytochrome c1 [Roseomonas sp. OT10]UFN50893.1 cytochrome c1 [Roseomonas sp. OT10]